jgi:deoxyribodipyrimidine photo-lyase
MSDQSTALVWFRRDLRLKDNPALSSALKAYDRVVLLYIHAPDEEAPWQPGAASKWWLHHSLSALQHSVRALGGCLTLERGGSLAVLQNVIRRYNVKGVFWNRLYEPALVERDAGIKNALHKQGVLCHSFNGSLLNEPHAVTNKTGAPYRVFSAYWRNCEQGLRELAVPADMPAAIPCASDASDGVSLDALGLMPRFNWYGGFSDNWQPGETGAWRMLDTFLEQGINDYKTGRDFPAQQLTSRLSPHLHFGEISPRQMIWTTNIRQPYRETIESHRRHFFSEIGWREFAYYLIYHFPDSAVNSLDNRFDRAGWVDSKQAAKMIERWKQGQTGIPLVDAGMRELWHTGWMHNRVRMIVASLLTKNLGVHWLEGARWFWDTLLDADLPANTLGWQWTAGCGVDAAPYFRVFSPARQAERFDPDGEYIRHWVPELADTDIRYLHDGLPMANHAGYPVPMLDLSATRRQALGRWDAIRELSKQNLM